MGYYTLKLTIFAFRKTLKATNISPCPKVFTRRHFTMTPALPSRRQPLSPYHRRFWLITEDLSSQNVGPVNKNTL